jgi:hypothetical protein
VAEMKRVIFSYDSPLGKFWITPDAGGKVMLGLERHRLKRFSSARDAAFAVYDQKSGSKEWDSAEIPVKPKSLEQWRKGS